MDKDLAGSLESTTDDGPSGTTSMRSVRPVRHGADLSDIARPDRHEACHPSRRPLLRQALRRIVDMEGPLFEDVARRRLAEVWALRPIPNLMAAMAGAHHGRTATSEDGRTLLWPSDMEPTPCVDFRPPTPGTRRECEDVPMVELVDLARLVADHRFRGSHRSMASALGYSNLPPRIVGRLEAAIRLSRSLGIVPAPSLIVTRNIGSHVGGVARAMPRDP